MRVDIESSLPGINGGEAGMAGRLDADADARLENRMALDDGVGSRVDHSPIQGMSHCSDEPPGRVRGQFRVSIQGNDVSNGREHGYVSGFHGETVGRPEEQVVEVHQLAPFSLPTHPTSFRGVINAMTVQMQETAPSVRCILLIQLIRSNWSKFRPIHHARQIPARRRGIGQKGKVEMRVAIAQITNLEGVDVPPDLGFA